MRRRFWRRIERLQAVRVEPGDTLIASIPRGCPEAAIDDIRAVLAGEFPDNHVLVVVGLELWVGRSPKENDDD